MYSNVDTGTAYTASVGSFLILVRELNIAGRPKAALLFWFLKVVLLSICLWSASIVATFIAAHFAALCRAL